MDKLPFLALGCLVFIIPWEEQFAIVGLETFSRMLGAVAFLTGMAAIALTMSAKFPHRAMVWLTVFVAWSFASMLWTIDQEATLSGSITFLLLLVFAWLVWQFADSPSRQQWLMWFYILGTSVALAALFLGVARFTDASSESRQRITAEGANANTMAACLVAAVNFSVYLATRPGRKITALVKVFYWVFIAAAGCGVFYTGSRSGVLALGVSIFLNAVVVFRVIGWKPAAIFGFCLLVGASWSCSTCRPACWIACRREAGPRACKIALEAWQDAAAKWTEQPLQGFGTNTNGGVVSCP